MTHAPLSLAALLGPNPRPFPRDYRTVRHWIMGGNDQPNTGDCMFTACANLKLLTTGQRMTDGEVLHAYSQIAGWMPRRPETDHGARAEDVLEYWRTRGWPSDPLDRIDWCALTTEEIPVAVKFLGAAIVWAMLPRDQDGEWDFSDDNLEGDGVGPHAMLCVEADDGFALVSWAAVWRVSAGWWDRFGRGAFGVRMAT